MRCACGGDTLVVESREQAGQVRRRRECHTCKTRFTTTEREQSLSLEQVDFILSKELERLKKVRSRLRGLAQSTPAVRKPSEPSKRARLRRDARTEALETGVPVELVYQRWGVA